MNKPIKIITNAQIKEKYIKYDFMYDGRPC
jgi:hypothetical protein